MMIKGAPLDRHLRTTAPDHHPTQQQQHNDHGDDSNDDSNEDAALIDSFFLPGGILDPDTDHDDNEDDNSHSNGDGLRTKVTRVPSNPWRNEEPSSPQLEEELHPNGASEPPTPQDPQHFVAASAALQINHISNTHTINPTVMTSTAVRPPPGFITSNTNTNAHNQRNLSPLPPSSSSSPVVVVESYNNTHFQHDHDGIVGGSHLLGFPSLLLQATQQQHPQNHLNTLPSQTSFHNRTITRPSHRHHHQQQQHPQVTSPVALLHDNNNNKQNDHHHHQRQQQTLHHDPLPLSSPLPTGNGPTSQQQSQQQRIAMSRHEKPLLGGSQHGWNGLVDENEMEDGKKDELDHDNDEEDDDDEDEEEGDMEETAESSSSHSLIPFDILSYQRTHKREDSLTSSLSSSSSAGQEEDEDDEEDEDEDDDDDDNDHDDDDENDDDNVNGKDHEPNNEDEDGDENDDNDHDAHDSNNNGNHVFRNQEQSERNRGPVSSALLAVVALESGVSRHGSSQQHLTSCTTLTTTNTSHHGPNATVTGDDVNNGLGLSWIHQHVSDLSCKIMNLPRQLLQSMQQTLVEILHNSRPSRYIKFKVKYIRRQFQSLTTWIAEMTETAAAISVQVLALVSKGFLAVTKALILLGSLLFQLWKYSLVEAFEEANITLCYIVFYNMPRVCSFLMESHYLFHIITMPHWTPHLLTTLAVFSFCHQISPGPLVVLDNGNISSHKNESALSLFKLLDLQQQQDTTDNSTNKTHDNEKDQENSQGENFGKNKEDNNDKDKEKNQQNHDKRSRRGADTSESSPQLRRRDERACKTILRILRFVLPAFFLADGFSTNFGTIMGVSGASRLTTAYMMSLVRKNLVSSPIGWVSWAIQVLMATYYPTWSFLDHVVLVAGLSSIRLIRYLEEGRRRRRREEQQQGKHHSPKKHRAGKHK